jgi:ribosomal protein S18 acetylase RimI-like enzyme
MADIIRRAEKRDALHVAAIVDMAGHGIEMDVWAGKVGDDHSPLSAARTSIITDASLVYHYSKAFILACDGDIAGGLVGGRVEEGAGIDLNWPPHFAPLLELESFVPEYWAVICVAVYPEYRAKGLSRRLLDFAREEARRVDSKGLSIVVEDSNTPALSLYRSWGFAEREKRPWIPYGTRRGPKSWILLTRPF